MNRKILLFILPFILLASIAVGKQYGSYAYLFVGRWQPAENPLVIEDYGFQDIQNLRRDGKRLRGVAGHTKINSSVINGTYKYPANGFHFKKDQPAETHIIVFAQDSNNTANVLYQNTTAIPVTGDFLTTALYTNSGTDLGRFSRAPGGNMLYANGAESIIWGGNEYRPGAVITSTTSVSTSTISNAKNWTAALINTSSDTGYTTTIDSSGYKVFVVGSTRPLQGIKPYVSTANTTTATLSGYEWTGSAWSALSLTDNTSGLATTGTVIFTSTDTTSKPKYMEGFIQYWYQFELSAGSATINYLTVDAPIQTIKNNWDGTESTVAAFKYYNGTNYVDYTDEVITNDTNYFAVLDSMATTHHVTIGFADPQQALNMRFLAGKENTNASVLTVNYWDGDSWDAISNVSDGTDESGDTFGKTGVISWPPIAEGTEFQKAIADEVPLYYYQLTVSAAIDAEVELYYVTGIVNPPTVPGYRFPGEFQSRAWLFSETGGDQNKAIYSAYNAPDVWSGPDSGELYFGDETKLTGYGVLYNLYNTSGIEQMIVTKQDETYRIYGNGPDNWVVQKMSSNVGCVAPLSIAICEISDVGSNVPRHVMLWQSDHGVIMCDGAGLRLISDDIKMYWDETSSLAIPTARLDDSFGWYDKNLGSYKLLISSGSGQTTHNIELEYNLQNNTWTKVYRENASGANPLQIGLGVTDTNGNYYTYGMTDEGYMYRTENGTDWDGIDIIQKVRTKDLLLDGEKPLMKDTVIEYLRLAFEYKDGTARTYWVDADGTYIVDEDGNYIIFDPGEEITVTHYCNGDLTVDGIDYQKLPGAFNLNEGPVFTTDVNLGPCLIHSFELSGRISTLTDGLEVTGLGLYFTTQDTISME